MESAVLGQELQYDVQYDGEVMKMVEGVLHNVEVRQAFATAKGSWCKDLDKYAFYATQGANLEGWLTHAQNVK